MVNTEHQSKLNERAKTMLENYFKMNEVGQLNMDVVANSLAQTFRAHQPAKLFLVPKIVSEFLTVI